MTLLVCVFGLGRFGAWIVFVRVHTRTHVCAAHLVAFLLLFYVVVVHHWCVEIGGLGVCCCCWGVSVRCAHWLFASLFLCVFGLNIFVFAWLVLLFTHHAPVHICEMHPFGIVWVLCVVFMVRS